MNDDRQQCTRRDVLVSGVTTAALGGAGCLRLQSGRTDTPPPNDGRTTPNGSPSVTPEATGTDERRPLELQYEVDTRSSGITVDGGVLYGSSGFALDLDTGDRRWETSVDRGTRGVSVAGDALYVTVRGEGGSTPTLRSIDAVTGEPNWEFTGSHPDSNVAAAIGDGYVAWADYEVAGSVEPGTVYLLDPATGDPIFEIDKPTDDDGDDPISVVNGLVVDAGRLYVSCDRTFAYDLRERTERWQNTVAFGSVAVDGDHVYVPHSGVTKYTAGDGDRAWRYDPRDRITSSVVLTTVEDGTGRRDVALAGGETAVYCVDSGDGSLVWKANSDGQVRIAPVVTGDAVCYTDEYGTLYVVERATGERVHRRDLEKGSYTDVATDGALLAVADRTLKVFSLS